MLYLRLFLPFGFGYLLSYLFRTVNAVIAPDLVRDLGLDPSNLGLLTASYFLAFAALQLPVGLLLDRYGPRRVEAGLLLVAAIGALLFSRAEGLGGLLAGRALIGAGVAACLMAAFKAFSLWFPAERLALANGVQMISGGIGALSATRPVEFALQLTDWRGVFLVVSGLTLLAALLIFLLVPEKPGHPSGESLGRQIAAIGQVYGSREFWCIAPWAFTAQAAYLSLLGLWSGPWLRDVGHFDRSDVATVLMGVAIAMTVGYLLFGTLADWLGRRGVTTQSVASCGMLLFMLVQLLIVLAPGLAPAGLWLLFGLFGTSCILPYAVVAKIFPAQLIGRANTALNLLVFLAAFSGQWLVGAVIGLWPESASGGYDPAGYQVGFGLLLGGQFLAVIWFCWLGRHRQSSPDSLC
jgi:MFS family permease